MPRARKRPRDEEVKFFDTLLDFQIDATAEVPATGQLCLIPQGAADNRRIGRVVEIVKIEIHGVVWYVPGASTTGSTCAEIWIVLDKQANGAALTIASLLETGTNLCIAMPNAEEGDRYVVLGKLVYAMNARAGVSGGYSNHMENVYWSYDCSIPIEFSGATGAITEIRSNNICLVAGSYPGDDVVFVDGYARVHFRD